MDKSILNFPCLYISFDILQTFFFFLRKGLTFYKGPFYKLFDKVFHACSFHVDHFDIWQISPRNPNSLMCPSNFGKWSWNSDSLLLPPYFFTWRSITFTQIKALATKSFLSFIINWPSSLVTHYCTLKLEFVD